VAPIVGDLFDFAWKSNNRNMALLERHVYHGPRATAGDWLFVSMVTALVVVIAAIPFLLAALVLVALGRAQF
jgi:hypothetical protein